MDNKLHEQVLRTVRNYEMLRPGDRVLVCVSGGPDSIFLLYALYRLKDRLKLELDVCNLDHGLRGRESAGDSRFVAGVCDGLNLGLIRKRINLRRPQDKKLSLEERARIERYNFFIESARKARSDVIATGHTLDDQAETVLMRLIKGTSLKGAIGIPPAREEDGFRIIRPLIEIERESIAGYLKSARIGFRVDKTNLKDVYFRNVVRNRVIRYLEKYNPKIKRALFNFAEHLREDYEFINRERLRRSEMLIKPGGGYVMVGLKDIVVQPKALQKEIMRDSLIKAGGNIKKLTFRHWKEIDNLIKFKRKGSSLDLPGGIRLARTDKALVFSKIL